MEEVFEKLNCVNCCYGLETVRRKILENNMKQMYFGVETHAEHERKNQMP
jgi:hypothetical protein